MMKKFLLLVCFVFTATAGVLAQTITSPNGKLSLTFSLSSDGQPSYSLNSGPMAVLLSSRLGIALEGQPDFVKNFSIASCDSSVFDQTWKPVWGEVKEIRNHYRELVMTLVQRSVNNRTLVLKFRLFDDGLGFRYEFPEQKDLQYFTVTDELTEFKLTGDHQTFWIPGDYDTNEYSYSHTPLSKVDANVGRSASEIGVKSVIGQNAVQTPLMMKSSDGLYINIHEAALVNYPAMDLLVDAKTFTLTSLLVPNAVGSKAFMQTPCRTPWRTVIVSDKAADMLRSKLILNLNEPTAYEDVSWIKPMKFVGIWWEMHVGKSTWNYSDVNNVKLVGTDWSKLVPNGRHGATTENTKRYIDFATKHGFDGVLVEGWNIGWEDWYGRWKENVFDFVTPYPDFNVDELHRYAEARHIKLIMHHETSASATNYERRMDEAYRFMKKNGYDAVKTGYVGKIIPRGEHHDGQWMNNHYVYVAQKTAEYKIALDSHEPSRPTGLHRTYPNWLAAEAARGNEYNAWSIGNAPDHETILPFTRLMGGPMDYTPGIFQIKLDVYQAGKKEQVHTTLAKQLALYVTMYSPLQMAADLPENYEKHPDALRFIEDVAVDWDDTKIIEAEPGDYVTIARKAKQKEEWFIGSITDEHARVSVIPLDFLNHGQKYVATLYLDASDASWDMNPMAYTIENYIVTEKAALKIHCANGGGAAISIKPAGENDLKKFKSYQ
jgi:glucan 1,4-alpha-glucosidase